MGVEFYDDNAGTGSPVFGITRFTLTFYSDGSGTYSVIKDFTDWSETFPVQLHDTC